MGGYKTRSGRHANVRHLTLAGKAAYAATFNGASIELGDRGTACLTLDVTAITGTLDVTVETSADDATWRSVASFTQATGVSSQRKSFTGLDRFVRAVCTIGTGPTTFSIEGDAK